MPGNDFNIDDLLGGGGNEQNSKAPSRGRPPQRRSNPQGERPSGQRVRQPGMGAGQARGGPRPVSRQNGQSSRQDGHSPSQTRPRSQQTNQPTVNSLNQKSAVGTKRLQEKGVSTGKPIAEGKNNEVENSRIQKADTKVQNQSVVQKEQSEKPPKKLFTWYKIVFAVILGLAMIGGIFLTVTAWYTNNLRYPKQVTVDYQQTGMYALENYAEQVHNLEGIDENSYLPKELLYANSNLEIEDFMHKVASTVSYDSDEKVAKNIYGNDMIDKNSLDIVMEKSTVEEGEEISTFYVDYDAIEFNKSKIKKLMADEELKLGDVDYQNKLVIIFVRYINGMEELPIKEVRRVPNIQMLQMTGESEKDQVINYYVVLPEEDIFFDTELFSSEEFYNCLDRFSALAGDSVGTSIKRSGFSGWGKTAEIGSVPKPSDADEVSFGSLKESQEYLDYMEMPPEKQATMEKPARYGYKNTIARDWCGAYYWMNYVAPGEEPEVDENGNIIGKKPKLGNGTKEDPATFNTSVVTTMFDEEGNEVPIRVTLKEFGVSKKAIDWFESKDIQNRGINLNSGVQYCYMIFDVTNLSDMEITIKDNCALSDPNVNLSVRTGTIFGLQDSVTLGPDETGTIESWSRSTELYLKYLIWGADFDRRADVVWFRVLAGDLEDESQYKKVHVEGSTEPEDGVESVPVDDVDLQDDTISSDIEGDTISDSTESVVESDGSLDSNVDSVVE